MKNAPSAPDSGSNQVLSLFDSLLETSRELLEAARREDAQAIHQLMLKRGEILDRAGKAGLNQLSEPLREQLRGKMAELEPLDVDIQKQLTGLATEISEKLRGLQDTKSVLHNYKSELQRTNTRNKQA